MHDVCMYVCVGRAGYVGYLGPLKASTRKAPVKAPFAVAEAVVDQVQSVTDTVNKEVNAVQEAKP